MISPWRAAIDAYYEHLEDYDNEWFKVRFELSEELKQKYIEIFGKIYSLDELKKIRHAVCHGMH